jgi:diaminohydroxyphosphoribosylaminopyrimidine deaminase/5-amino-6-(5-phosphoribosylamino)uracil reductase
MMRALARRGCNEVHVEAGARLNAALLGAGLIDELLLYLAPSLIGDPARGLFERATPLASLAERVSLEWTSTERIGGDLRIVARVVPTHAGGIASDRRRFESSARAVDAPNSG